MSLSAIPYALRSEIFARDMGRCQYCHLSQVGQASIFHINHIIPRSKGGQTVLGNLVLQCPSCSLRKSNKVTAIDPTSAEELTLFNPLVDIWDSHFAIASNGRCLGLNAKGRATVEALRMNDFYPQLARAIQIQLGLLKSSSSQPD